MLLQDRNYLFKSKFALPNSNYSISAFMKVNILRLVSFLLCHLSFSKRFKSWMAVPVITIGLNDKIIYLDINYKFGLDKVKWLIRHIQIIQNTKKLLFQFSRLILLNTPMTLKHFGHCSFTHFWVIFIVTINFFYHLLVFHWVILCHIFLGRLVNFFIVNIRIKLYPFRVSYYLDLRNG